MGKCYEITYRVVKRVKLDGSANCPFLGRMLLNTLRTTLAALAAGAAVSAVAACASLPGIPGFRHDPAPSSENTVTQGGVLQPPGGRLTGYLAPAAYPDGIAILGPPPEPDSPQGRADRTIYEETRSLAGTPRWAQAIRDDDLSGPSAFKSMACAAGLTITAQTMPRTTTLLIRTGLDGSLVAAVPKRRYFRTRPLIGNDARICVPRADWLKTNGSYPSGHSMMGWSWALVIAELVPDHADAVLTRGREFGDSRVICGVHFQSDVAAGRILSSAMISRLHADKGFQADMAAARREVAKFRKSGAAPDCAGVTGQ
ncbi:MAG: Acid phosphatase [Caulobacter sp.]|nr:Acid phosphatase [Caulobacter sp.]